MSETIPSTAIERLWKLFSDKEYRRGFYRSHVGGSLAAQIFQLRKKSGITQRQLAAEIGSSQSQISAWESSCDTATLASLFKIADAFDVGLVVKFAPFSEIVREAITHDIINVAVADFDSDCPQAATYRVRSGPIVVSQPKASGIAPISAGNRRSFEFVNSGNPIADSAIQRKAAHHAI